MFSRRAAAARPPPPGSATWRSPACPRGRRRGAADGRGRPARPEAAALPGAGQARDLPVHGRRAVARRHVRLQAAADGRRRQAVRQGPVRRRPSCSASPWKFPQHGQSGPVDLASCSPTSRKHADDLCLLNGMHTDLPTHPQAFLQLHTGSFQFPPAVARGVGPVRPRHRERRTCPASSRSARRPTSAGRRTTAARSCRPPTRGPGSGSATGRSPTPRSPTSPTPGAARPPSGSSSTSSSRSTAGRWSGRPSTRRSRA